MLGLSHTLYRAAWVLPIVTPPIRDGWVIVRDGRVEWVGQGRPPALSSDRLERDLGARAILPGLVNAHTHLELSHLRGRIPPAKSMPVWVCDMLAARGFAPPPQAPIDAAIGEARRAGTAVLCDITNSFATIAPLVESGIPAAVFHEVLGFNPDGAAGIVAGAAAAIAALPSSDRVRVSLAVHAPYSSSPELFRRVRAWLDDERLAGSTRSRQAHLTSVHVGESPEELQFLDDGSGPWRELLEEFKVWNPAWTPPACGPVEYLDRLGFIRSGLLAVHGVQLDERELSQLGAAGATLVTCPRSNQWVGVGAPPVERFFASGVRVAIGTDSLASVADLNVFAELAELRRLAPSVPARALVASATRNGAAALGLAGELGVIAPGARAELIAVDVPPGVEDVEEYLVNGVQPEQVGWINDTRISD